MRVGQAEMEVGRHGRNPALLTAKVKNLSGAPRGHNSLGGSDNVTACGEENRQGLNWANRIFFSGLAWPH
jgi:hypothetical protein